MVESISVCYKSGERSVTAPVRRLPLLQTSCHCAGWRRGFGDVLMKMAMVKINILFCNFERSCYEMQSGCGWWGVIKWKLEINIFKRRVSQFRDIMVWDVIRVWRVGCNQVKTAPSLEDNRCQIEDKQCWSLLKQLHGSRQLFFETPKSTQDS